MTASTFNLDILVSIKSDSSQTIIMLRGNNEIFSAAKYFILGMLVYCLTAIRLMSDWIDEPVAWLKIAIEWGKAYIGEVKHDVLGRRFYNRFTRICHDCRTI